MHEWLITRGNVMGAPFEWQMQIYVPWNCVLVHEGTCHQEVQSGHKGRYKCWEYIRHYYQARTITEWLEALVPNLPMARERLLWMKEYADY